MNPQHRNALIAGINRMMEGLAMVGQALEADGWEQIEDEYTLAGPRPVAAARLEEPSFQAELEERLEAEQAGRLLQCVSTRSKRYGLSWQSCPSRATPPRVAN